jgi:hypoxanthine phosphoribosyltransferase
MKIQKEYSVIYFQKKYLYTKKNVFLRANKNDVFMSKITIDDKQFVKYISEKEIDEAVTKVAQAVNDEYKNDVPIIILVLNGSIIFGSDLLKKLTIPCRVSCIRLSSYEGVKSTANVKNFIGLVEDLKDQRVLIIEDIVDTGNTYEHILNMLKAENVKDVKIATMTYKPNAYKKPFPIDFVGIEIPNKFIVGRGLDYNGLGRNLPDIYQVC